MTVPGTALTHLVCLPRSLPLQDSVESCRRELLRIYGISEKTLRSALEQPVCAIVAHLVRIGRLLASAGSTEMLECYGKLLVGLLDHADDTHRESAVVAAGEVLWRHRGPSRDTLARAICELSQRDMNPRL